MRRQNCSVHNLNGRSWLVSAKVRGDSRRLISRSRAAIPALLCRCLARRRASSRRGILSQTRTAVTAVTCEEASSLRLAALAPAAREEHSRYGRYIPRRFSGLTNIAAPGPRLDFVVSMLRFYPSHTRSVFVTSRCRSSFSAFRVEDGGGSGSSWVRDTAVYQIREMTRSQLGTRTRISQPLGNLPLSACSSLTLQKRTKHHFF